MFKNLRIFISDFLRFFIIYLPGSTGRKIRYKYYRTKFKKCGRGVIIDEGVIIQQPEWISVGNNVWFDKYCIISAGPLKLEGYPVKRKPNKNFAYSEGELIIGDNVHISPFVTVKAYAGIHIAQNSGLANSVKIFSATNLMTSSSDSAKIIHTTSLSKNSEYSLSPITLGENVGVGLNSVLLPGVSIEKNSYVSPDSVVLGKFKENSFISGNPAKRVKERFKTKEEGIVKDE